MSKGKYRATCYSPATVAPSAVGFNFQAFVWGKTKANSHECTTTPSKLPASWLYRIRKKNKHVAGFLLSLSTSAVATCEEETD